MIRPLAILAALLISAPLCASAADADTVRHGLATKVDTMYAKWLLSSKRAELDKPVQRPH